MTSCGRCQAGFTIVEFAVSALLSGLFLIAVLEAYLAAAGALRWQQASSSTDLRGTRALDILSGELRMAGFFGGADPDRIAVPDAAPGCSPGDRWPLQPVAIVASQAGPAQSGARFGCLPQGELQPRSSLLGVRRVDGGATWGAASGWPGRRPRATQWYLRTRPDGRGDYRWVGEGLPREPGDADRINYWAVRARLYYLRRYSVRKGDGIPTLCVERLMGRGMRSECLVEGIEALHFEFAVDTDGDREPETLSSAPAADARLTHAHVYVLARSLVAPGAHDSQIPYALGARRLAMPDDGHLRRVYRATVPLHNHAPAS